jgi:hypothetical protein
VVAGQDAVSDGEAGVGGDHAVVGAGDGHARAAVVLVRVEPGHRLCSETHSSPPRSGRCLFASLSGLIPEVLMRICEARLGKGRARFA